MSRDQRQERSESVRKEILFHLYAVRPSAQLARVIAREAQKNRLDFDVNEIERELQFLKDEGLVIEVPVRGSTETLYRIHAEGVRVYEQTYAA